ncbi:MAG TPA: NAD(P)-dependent oxidoreductase [Allosphingosinicella sp.]|nr:NAD(P)-dependent oxidoreductase [Allosphingosinicella sp.]
MILVTGANGFVGRNLVLELLSRGERVVGIDRRPALDPAEVAGAGYAEEIFDLTDREMLKRAIGTHRPRTMIALAEAFDGPPTNLVARSVASFNALLDMASEHGVRRLCFASSLIVYLGLEGPFREEMPLPVHSPLHIGAIKKSEELSAQWYADNSALEIVALRLANIYGPRYQTMLNTPSRYLFDALGRSYPSRPTIGAEIYAQISDFCHVEDCAKGIAAVALAEKLAHRIYNIGSGQGVTDEALRRAVDLAVGRNEVAASPEPSRNHLDIARLSGELGYRPRHDIDSGIMAYCEWLETHSN